MKITKSNVNRLNGQKVKGDNIFMDISTRKQIPPDTAGRKVKGCDSLWRIFLYGGKKTSPPDSWGEWDKILKKEV